MQLLSSRASVLTMPRGHGFLCRTKQGDKQGHEVDFIWAPRGRAPLAVECKWSARDFDPANLAVFARAYPSHELLVVTTDAHPAFTREYAGRPVRFLTVEPLLERLA